MELGIFAKTFERPTLEETLDAVVAHGFRHVQFNMQCAGLEPLPKAIDPATVKRIRRACKQRGIVIDALSGSFNMAHPDKAVRIEGLRRLELLMAVANDLGALLISLCTGTRDPEYMWRHHPDNTSQEAWDDALRSLRDAMMIAKEYDVSLGIEPEPGTIVCNARKSRKMLRDVDQVGLGIIFDPANIIDGVPEDQVDAAIDSAIKDIGYQTYSVHGKDRDASGKVAPAGQGIVPWKSFIAGLNRVGYSGPIILHGLEEPDVAAAKDFIQRQLETI